MVCQQRGRNKHPLALDEDFQAAGCFAEIIHGYAMGLVEPNMMRGLQPVGPNRTTLEVIIPSQTGLTPERWKETATLCPLEWPSNYSLLRLWHTNTSLYRTEARLRAQLSHSHMFAEWTVYPDRFEQRALFQQPAVYVAAHVLQAQLRERNFPDRRARKKIPQADLDEHQVAIRDLYQHATTQERTNPVSFALTNEWLATITSDKQTLLGAFHKRYDMTPLRLSDRTFLSLIATPLPLRPDHLSFVSLPLPLAFWQRRFWGNHYLSFSFC